MRQGYDLVLIEDSVDDERVTLRAIRESGVSCLPGSFRDGSTALEYLLSGANALPRLVMLDLHLGKVSGLDILLALRGSEGALHVPIVLLSGSDYAAHLDAAYSAGANSYILKPVGFDQYMLDIGLAVRYWLTVNCVRR